MWENCPSVFCRSVSTNYKVPTLLAGTVIPVNLIYLNNGSWWRMAALKGRHLSSSYRLQYTHWKASSKIAAQRYGFTAGFLWLRHVVIRISKLRISSAPLLCAPPCALSRPCATSASKPASLAKLLAVIRYHRRPRASKLSPAQSLNSSRQETCSSTVQLYEFQRSPELY